MGTCGTAKAAYSGAREVTLDFARIGAQTKAVNQIVAFWNAAVQGTEKFARVHKESPKKAVVRGMVGITLPSMVLYALNRNNPDYAEEPRWQKDMFWLISTRGTRLYDETKFIRIPKPFLWGMVYGSMPERVMEWIDKKDPSAFDDMANDLLDQSVPSLMPTAMVPLIEAWANKSFFTGRRLEPEYMQDVEPRHREKLGTSEFAHHLSEGLHSTGIKLSPIMIDQLLYGYTGGGGRHAVELLDMAIPGDKNRPARKAADIPMLGAFAVRSPSPNAESLHRFYERLQELEKKSGSDDYLADRGEPMVMSPDEATELGVLKSYSKSIRALNRDLRQVQAEHMDPKEKRRRMDELQEEMIDLAREALGEVKELTVVAPVNP